LADSAEQVDKVLISRAESEIANEDFLGHVNRVI